MKSMRDYINLVETAMTESKNKQDFEHHRDMAKLATDPGRRAIHAAKATKAGQRWDNEKKQASKNQGVAEEQLEETSPEAIAKIEQLTRR